MPTDPSGNASRAAMSSRNGVVGVIDSGDGITNLRISRTNIRTYGGPTPLCRKRQAAIYRAGNQIFGVGKALTRG
jgi:hypothetical protein